MIGCRYEGEFADGGGTGTISYPDGGSYQGSWKALLRSGQGKYTGHHDRDEYEVGGSIYSFRSIYSFGLLIVDGTTAPALRVSASIEFGSWPRRIVALQQGVFGRWFYI
jgi:hypothetical protein